MTHERKRGQAAMPAFLLKRVLAGVVLLIAVSFLAFVLLNLSSSNVARGILGQNATAEQVDLKAQQLGLDRPILFRYAEWALGAARGDLGTSWFTNESITGAISNRLPVTLSVVISVTIISGLIAFALGIAAGVRRGALDRTVQVLSILGFALPGFLVALLLVFVFGIQLGWVPATGYVPVDVSFAGWVSTITLPVIALSLAAIAGVAQQVRSAAIDTLNKDFIRTLRSRGLPERRIILRHVVKNSASAGLTVLAIQFVALLGGTVVIEQVFALPGIGSYAVSETSRGDLPAVMGVVIVAVIIVVIVNLLVDIGVGWLNPKGRLS
ncbi:ABC transporter permease [Microbacterium sp. PMB16]|uniref:ABC transporter permease n=1 Tax=Microbacterium sp. PMB16 TaxID=3120157 RepID=UPI003F4BC0AF